MYGTVTDTGTVELAQLIAAMAGKLDTSRYEADVWKRAIATASVLANGTINDSNNIASVTRVSAGVYDLTFMTPLSNAFYKVSGSTPGATFQITNKTVSGFRFTVANMSSSNYDQTFDVIVHL